MDYIELENSSLDYFSRRAQKTVLSLRQLKKKKCASEETLRSSKPTVMAVPYRSEFTMRDSTTGLGSIISVRMTGV